ncbi:MAG: TolC family protein [Pseudomonadota bacterium]|nr:TolC family protein [Pseudomonadota bacterium]
MRGDLSSRVWLAAVLSVTAQSSMANVTPMPSTSLSETTAAISSNPSLSTVQAVSVEPATVLSLADALRYAAAYPRAEQHMLMARQQLRQAALLNSQQRPNPELSFDMAGLRRTGDQEVTQSFSLSQKIDLFGTRSAQQRLTQLQLEAEQFNQNLYPQALALAVKAAYQQVVLAEQALKLAQEQQQLSQQSLDVAQKRVQAGRTAEIEATRLAIQHRAINADLSQAQATHQLARQQLSLYWGNPNPQFLQTTGTSAWPNWSRAALDVQLAQDPQQIIANYALQQSAAQLDLAQRQRYGAPTVSFGIENNQSANGSSAQVLLGVSMPLPIFSQNQASVIAAQAAQSLAQSQAQISQRQRQRVVYRLWQQQQNIISQYHSLQAEQIPLAKTVQQKMLIGFEAGKFSVLEVQQAQQDVLQRQQQAQQLLVAGWEIVLRLEAIFAGLPIDSNLSDPSFIDNLYLNQAQDGYADAAGWSGVTP